MKFAMKIKLNHPKVRNFALTSLIYILFEFPIVFTFLLMFSSGFVKYGGDASGLASFRGSLTFYFLSNISSFLLLSYKL